MLAVTSSPQVLMDWSCFLVLDCPVPHVYTIPACKLDSSSVDMNCLPSSPSTSACEMNICSSSGIHASHVAVQQVMNSDAALNSVIISKTKSTKSHFHITCLLKGHHRTTKVAAMVDSGATSLFIDRKFVNQHKMLLEPLKQPITLYNIDRSLNEAGSVTHKV